MKGTAARETDLWWSLSGHKRFIFKIFLWSEAVVAVVAVVVAAVFDVIIVVAFVVVAAVF